MDGLTPMQIGGAILLALISALVGVCGVLGFVVKYLLRDNTEARKENTQALDKYLVSIKEEREGCAKQNRLTRRLLRKLLMTKENDPRPFGS